jgi:DNA polymerase-3 subunit alpha
VGDRQEFNLMEDPKTLMDEGIFHVAFPFGRNWYYYDLREEFALNILKYIGRPKEPEVSVPFCNLGVHTPFELLNASGDVSVWVKKAKWLGGSAIGICDRNTMAATLILQKECAKVGLKHVFGYSLTLDFFGEDVDMKVYCRTQQGLGNLLRIQKEIMVDRDDGKIDLEGLLNHAAGNVLVLGTLSAYWMAKNPKPLADLRRAFEGVNYQFDPTEYKADRIDQRYLNNLRQFFHLFHRDGVFEIEPVLIPDCHYLDSDDAESKIILNKIACGASHNQSEHQYLRTTDELYRATRSLFDPLGWDIDALFERMCRNAVEIAAGSEARYEIGRMYMPRYDMLPEEVERFGNRREMFLRLLDEGLEAMIPETDHKRYRQRLSEEIYIIESTGNVDYFLIQWDMIREAKRRGITTGIGRGSAGGSLVSYLLGITSIDPIRYDLLFSRFLVPERCGLFWKEEVTRFCGEISIEPRGKYVEVMLEGKRICFDTDAQLRIVRGEDEMTLYADELQPDDRVIMDNRDMLWNI